MEAAADAQRRCRAGSHTPTTGSSPRCCFRTRGTTRGRLNFYNKKKNHTISLKVTTCRPLVCSAHELHLVTATRGQWLLLLRLAHTCWPRAQVHVHKAPLLTGGCAQLQHGGAGPPILATLGRARRTRLGYPAFSWLPRSSQVRLPVPPAPSKAPSKHPAERHRFC